MKILLVFRGNIGPIVGDGRSIPDTLATRGTSHPSEVNALLVAHWLQRDYGHEVHWQCARPPGRPRDWLLPPVAPDDDLSTFDAVLTWKIPGVKLAQSLGLFERSTAGTFAAWFDAGGFAAMLADGERDRYTHVMLGTAEHYAVQRDDFPAAHVCVVEHATGIVADVDPVPATDRGVYFGRLPAPYLRGIRDCARFAALDVYGLQAPTLAGVKGHTLRPGQYSADDVEAARSEFAGLVGGDAVLYPAINLSEHSAMMGRYLFGLVPPTRPRPAQLSSASKAWDCWGLGLPVLMGQSVPEARHLKAAPLWLGELYDPAHPDTMRNALQAIADRAAYHRGFTDDRRAIAAWAHEHHTYRNRAQEIHDAITR